jgi:hypothetical protein
MDTIDEYTLTCKVGHFIFKNDTPLSLAKVIRDAVMSRILGVNEDGPKPHTTEEANSWVMNHLQGPASRFGFTFVPR